MPIDPHVIVRPGRAQSARCAVADNTGTGAATAGGAAQGIAR
jgi:hypothetical protein